MCCSHVLHPVAVKVMSILRLVAKKGNSVKVLYSYKVQKGRI